MSASCDIVRVTFDQSVSLTDEVAVEEPLEIRVEGKSVAVTMRTPGHDRELAAGFLLSEGIIAWRGDLFDIVQCPSVGSEGNVVDATLADASKFDPERFSRHVLTTASCGLCGKTSLDQLRVMFPPVESDFCVSRQVLFGLPAALGAVQETFQRTGGLHAAAIFDGAGVIQTVREDVGRHNALDKLLGWALFGGLLPLRDRGLLVSGRVSFEIVQKALAGGIPVIAAIGAASSLAVQAAEEGGQTLAGFLRDGRVNVYCGVERIR